MASRTSFQNPPQSAKPMGSFAQPGLVALAEPPLRYVDGAMMDYFLIEVVNTLRESSQVATARSKKIEKEMLEAGLLPPVAAPAAAVASRMDVTSPRGTPSPRDSTTSLSSTKVGGKASAPVDEEEEALRVRLEAIGIHVGANFTERLCRDRALFTETLDAVKFICKDLWSSFWNKQVDNLRTNHRGVYVLQDNSFHTISRLSSWKGRPEALKRAKAYVVMPAGIIKGALNRLGYQAVTVTPEINSLPQCTFQVKIPRNP
ncbi:transport protein particle component [Marasmius fiardii PR-910]|nr:transport protein particle component [Marasmius fiardii PR-910]